MFYPNVAEGVHRIEDSFTNWYLLEEDRRLTVVDTGVPTSWPSLIEALRSLGRRLSDIEAVVLTRTLTSTIWASLSALVPISACRFWCMRMMSC